MKHGNSDGHNLAWTASTARVAAVFYPVCIVLIVSVVFAIKHFFF